MLDNKFYSSKIGGITKDKWSMLDAPLIDSGDVTEELKLAALDSLSRLDMSAAAAHGAALLALGRATTGVLSPFLNREGGGPALTAALAKRKPGAAPAAVALAKLQSEGLLECDPIISPVAVKTPARALPVPTSMPMTQRSFW